VILLVPMVAGVLLLTLAIAISDLDEPAFPGSPIAIRIAGYLAVAAISLWLFIPPTVHVLTSGPGTAQTAHSPSHLVVIDQRWNLLPGGNKYGEYRKQRLEASNMQP